MACPERFQEEARDNLPFSAWCCRFAKDPYGVIHSAIIQPGMECIHHRERWTNELRLVYADGRTLKLTETPVRKEGDTDGECTSAAQAA
jgi:hypothetical protein